MLSFLFNKNYIIFIDMFRLIYIVVIIMVLYSVARSLYSQEIRETVSCEIGAEWPYREVYHRYLSAYYRRLMEKGESLSTVRPFTEIEFEAVMRSVEFIYSLCEKEEDCAERRFLLERFRALHNLLEYGRIKYDDDYEEARNATKMTTHVPSDPSDPYEGDIYVHEEGLLQGVYLPLEGLKRLQGAEITEKERIWKKKVYERSLFEGLVLLSSYLVHEYRHRSQNKFIPREGSATEEERYKYILDMEDPAYSDQYHYLLIVSGIVNDKELKHSVRSIRDTIVGEVNEKFPELKEFRKVQREWK